MKNKICISAFCYENKLTYPRHISDQKFKNSLDLLIISNKIKSNYEYIKDFNKCMFNKTKKKNRKNFCKYCLQCFSSGKSLVKHKEIWLKRNDKQTVHLKSGFIELKNYSRKIPAPFKIYADFDCILKSLTSNKGFDPEKFQDLIPSSFYYKLVCVDNKFSKPIVVYRGEMMLINLLKQFLKSMNTVKK